MSWQSNNPLFRDLNANEVREYRQWARENFNARTDKISSVWHPVVQDECRAMQWELVADEFNHSRQLEDFDRGYIR